MSERRLTNIGNLGCCMNIELYLVQEENNLLSTVHSLHSSQSENVNVIMLFHCWKPFNNSQMLLG